jgi:hypothetical protein
LEPGETGSFPVRQTNTICTLLKQPGCEVISRRCGPGLFAELRRDHPDVGSTWPAFTARRRPTWRRPSWRWPGWLTPALACSPVLAHNYSQLLPLLAGVSLRLPPSVAGTAGECALPPDFAFPLYLYVDGDGGPSFLPPPGELAAALSACPLLPRVAVLETAGRPADQPVPARPAAFPIHPRG